MNRVTFYELKKNSRIANFKRKAVFIYKSNKPINLNAGIKQKKFRSSKASNKFKIIRNFL